MKNTKQIVKNKQENETSRPERSNSVSCAEYKYVQLVSKTFEIL